MGSGNWYPVQQLQFAVYRVWETSVIKHLVSAGTLWYSFRKQGRSLSYRSGGCSVRSLVSCVQLHGWIIRSVCIWLQFAHADSLFLLFLWVSDWSKRTGGWKERWLNQPSDNNNSNNVHLSCAHQSLSAHMIHINLNMIFYTHVDHSPTKRFT